MKVAMVGMNSSSLHADKLVVQATPLGLVLAIACTESNELSQWF